jgi:deoxyribodipyrimidine photolyase-related protein
VSFTRALYIPFDHLHREYGVLAKANPQADRIIFVESERMRTGRNWHPERLFFLISSARHFVETLRGEGFSVDYLKAPTTYEGISNFLAENSELALYATTQSSFRLQKTLEELGANFVENDFFLTERAFFEEWAARQKSYLMENFYREQRRRLDVLMENGKPVGGEWNFDKENRLPPPKEYNWPVYEEFERDDIDQEVARDLGITPTGTWATTREGAVRQLKRFISKHFANFGPYEDAMALDSWSLHHSVISPYINNGLLHPREVLTAAVKAFESGKIPIESAEGFIRQVIGWREYINGMYWHLGEEYRENNRLNADRPLLPLFTSSDKTEMNCVRSIVGDVERRAWVHHIPRLMVLSNLALITGTNPQEFLEWMRERFIDAADWVMVPNVIGMGVHADGGQMMTKPYAAGGAYISRMSQYCKGCVYDPKLRIGDNACPFTTLYWDFLDRNREIFSKNHRMFQQINGLKRLSDLPELRQRAKEVLLGLSKGEI